jgi:hypothetical protein
VSEQGSYQLGRPHHFTHDSGEFFLYSICKPSAHLSYRHSVLDDFLDDFLDGNEVPSSIYTVTPSSALQSSASVFGLFWIIGHTFGGFRKGHYAHIAWQTEGTMDNW